MTSPSTKSRPLKRNRHSLCSSNTAGQKQTFYIQWTPPVKATLMYSVYTRANLLALLAHYRAARGQKINSSPNTNHQSQKKNFSHHCRYRPQFCITFLTVEAGVVGTLPCWSESKEVGSSELIIVCHGGTAM